MLLLITSCSRSTVEDDVKAYCQCVQNINTKEDKVKCIDMAQEMLDKYSSDPEAAVYIEEHLKGCATTNK